ncbi:hypothetical protein VTK56DRAFT_7866 [Thermocarpiscus australiensis]
MSDPWTLENGSGNRIPATIQEEWEDWEDDDEVLTPIAARDGPLMGRGPASLTFAGEARRQSERRASRRLSSSAVRISVQNIRRLKSRQRQKAQNARAGIKLVTDMSKFRQQHIAHQMRPVPENRESRTGKFVDAAALKALEGAPSDDSPGALTWLKRKPTKGKRVERLVAESSPQADLSPSAGPIVIGFAMPSDSNVIISPQTAVVETPVDFPQYFKSTNAGPSKLPTSAWSPDTDDGASPQELGNTAPYERSYVPAVPSIPEHYKAHEVSPLTASDDEYDYPPPTHRKNHRDTAMTAIHVSDDDDDDMGTPVTLFEEDGSPATTRHKSFAVKSRQRSATAGSSRSQGWWDQVTSPFAPQTPASPRTPDSSGPMPGNRREWFKEVDKKKPLSRGIPESEAETSSGTRRMLESRHQPPEIVIEDVSAAPSSSTQPVAMPSQSATWPEKSRVSVEEVNTPGELPPPYSPPSRNHHIRYHAVFPPGHPLRAMYPPSPGPVPPGLSQTMTSQGAINLTDVPLTPPPASNQMPLPDRPLGSFVPGDHFVHLSGHGPRQEAERRRRRHEKEDVVAYKVGRLWRDRGCSALAGCFGRPGREGRKRRRVCLGICVTTLVLITLGVALGITLSRRTVAEPSMPSQWLNLTDFPPIPTGISTIIGPDSKAITACVQPPTLWSCSLPKEQAGSVAPFDASQPSFVLQIQFDNSTRRLWDVTGQETPRPTPTDSGNGLPLASLFNQTTTRSVLPTRTPSPRALPVRSGPAGVASFFRRLVKADGDEPASSLESRSASSLELRSDPPPPSFQEMFFLGNTTDGVVSDDKAGEPTPFYISMLRSVNDTVGPNLLSRRGFLDMRADGLLQANLTAGAGLLNASDIAPPPALDKDGAGAAAVLLGFPVQQPLRLYDRGLPTERYGFYSYYNKTMYVKSVDPLVGGGESTPVPADLDGGSLKTEAKFLVTWLSVRYKVEIWTRRASTTRLVGGLGGRPAGDNSTQPGTFPYPVTITLDTHGGQPGKKFAFIRGVDDRQRIVLNDAKFLLNNMNTTGDLVNPASKFNPSFGGMDGGTGGCKCEYTNFVGVNGG